MVGTELPLDTEDCQQPSNNEQDIPTLEQAIPVARLALHSPAIDVNNRGEANKVTDEKDIGADHLSELLSITHVESLALYGEQRYQGNAGDSSIFISNHSM
jgi:hypothetical protein